MYKKETMLIQNPDSENLKKCADIIRRGGTVAFPTETVYGLGADALNVFAVEKIFDAKGRPFDNPLIIHLHDVSKIGMYVKEIPDTFFILSKLYMPGPLTVILKKKDIIPTNVTAGLDTVAVRVPDNDIARKFLQYCDTPVAAPSANLSGKPSPTSYQHVVNDLFGRVDAIINGGTSEIGVESTVLDLTSDIPHILRPGGISSDKLKLVLKKVRGEYSTDEILSTPKSPGMKYRHYAPRAQIVLIKGDTEKVINKINDMTKDKTGVLCSSETFDRYISKNKLCAGSIKDPASIAKNMYECLRLFDTMDISTIYCEYFDMPDIGEAVINRLIKAASGNILEL